MAKRKQKKVSKIKISACYIVKDAAEDLRRSLESVAKFVDEIVVVDTGSTDSTIDVAKNFGAKIFHEPWQNDFSTPRNVALKEATGDWIVFLDADEYFVDGCAKNLRAVIKLALKAKAQGLSVKWVNVDADKGNAVINASYVLRIFQNAPNVHYVGKIHEDVFLGEELLTLTAAPAKLLTLNHTGYSSTISRAKAERNLKLLLEELATTDKPERIYAYLADAYYGLEDWANVEKFARLDLGARKNPSNRPIRLLIECLEKNPSRFEECFEFSKLAVERYPLVPEFSAKLADCFARKENYCEAVAEMNRALEKFKNYGEQFESTNFDEEKVNAARRLIDEWQKKIVLTPEEKRREVSRLTDELIHCFEVTHDMETGLKVAAKIFDLKPDEPEPFERVASFCIYCSLAENTGMVLDYLEENFPPSRYRVMLRARYHFLKKNYSQTIKVIRQALAMDDDGDSLAAMMLYNLLGQAYREMGSIENALKYSEHNMRLDLSSQKNFPSFEQLKNMRVTDHNNYLFDMHSLNFSREEIFEVTRAFNKYFAHVPRFKHNRKKHAAHKKIRVGYISGDIRFHVVAYFSLHLFVSYDKTRFEVFLYANNAEDKITARFKERVDAFRNILNKKADEVAAQIMEDEIDILFDLAGHTRKNSLPVLARKPAPIQISGIGYFDSTGLNAVDYFLADKFTDPEGLNEKFFTEKILRLQHSHFCYEWHDLQHPVAPAPCTKAGYVTFVSFNAFTKVTDEMLALWKKILDAVPDSRLYLKTSAFDAEESFNFARERIRAAGIDLMRVDMEPSSKDYVRCYERADIALDTFPYPGGGTTCDALYMGVPVITLVGERHNSRFGYSLLMNIGLGELCAFSEEEYFQKAVALANDRQRLREYHLTIRRKMEESPVMNDTIYMGEIEAAYEKIFSAWLANEPLPDFPQEPAPVTEELAEKFIARALEYVPLENELGESNFESRFDFKRTLYYSELAAQCKSKIDAKLLLTIADRRHLLNDNRGAYEMMRATLDYIYSPAGAEKNYPKDFIAECHKKMAGYAHDNRRHAEAVDNDKRAFELIDDEARCLEVYEAILLGLHFLDISNEDMTAFHFDYQKFFDDLKPFTTYHARHERIRVAYISGDFRHHAAFAVTFGFISCHDRSKFEITCYSKNKKDDEYTELYRKAVEHFVDVQKLSAEELAKKIHDDEIDIAFDLAGHTGLNALPALAYRPAPVQICGLGYMSTTGSKAIDYFLTDEVLDPPGAHEKFFSEKLLYMPAQFSYARREDLAASTGAACVENGFVTFGTICRYSKMTDEMLAIWTEILNRVPNAKLLMRAQEFISNRCVDELYDTLKALGCDMDRVIFRPAVPDYFDAISKIDIMLDGYPYVGGATTLDALYMGVPVISFYGARRSTRFGKSILTSVGLEDLAVDSVEAYINTAVALARDTDFLDALHRNLRQMFLDSPALDPMKYCRLLEKKFLELLG
ncbi:MAG: glycosyltransferase [Selenomonadaceae bacterium]|nr:glycosyltransferase [Selenomonadaceae bacterium]